MTKTAVADVIRRAVSDVDFRERLLRQSDDVLEAFNLSPSEMESLKAFKESAIGQLSEDFRPRARCATVIIID